MKIESSFGSLRTPIAAVLWCGFALSLVAAADAPAAKERQKAAKLQRDGNYKDAYEIFRKLALDPRDEADKVGGDLEHGVKCLQDLDREDETDEFRETVIKTHAENWRLLWAAARSLFDDRHYGYIVAGEFKRGEHRGGGREVNAFERDRVRMLQLMDAALEKIAGERDMNALCDFHLAHARMLLGWRESAESRRLQYLTDLAKLPDYDDGFYSHGGETTGAPVNDDSSPVFHHVPKSYAGARTDGERWRWSLTEAMEAAPSRENAVLLEFANFLHQQFGAETLAEYGRLFAGDDGAKQNETGTFALHTLGEDETIARLATGVKRFKLPDEFNFIKIYERIADAHHKDESEPALNVLAEIFENRRQFDRAADLWQRDIREFGAGEQKWKQKRADQILGAWGQFEPVMAQPAGKGATVDFRFRNGASVSFEAHEVLVPKLLADVKEYLKSNPRRFDDERREVANIGWRLVDDNQTRYRGERVASWELKLEPREHHFDKRITVQTPLQKPGAYLVTARVAGGNTCKIIVWVADTVIVKKPIQKGSLYFVADAVSGKPIAKANVEFFGYRLEQRDKKLFGREHDVVTANFAEFTDANGQLILPPKKGDERIGSWLITATTETGRFAYLGFTGIWSAVYADSEYNRTKVFTITDRPVYRPNQPVKFKFWVRHAKYDQEDTSSFAHKNFTMEIHDPKDTKVFEKNFVADDYGGFDGELDLPADAALGVYRIEVLDKPRSAKNARQLGGGDFRVEEYKKPEFEVSVEAPGEPVMLGEKIGATVSAKYFFGAPVANAKVKYKVLRSAHDARWFPPMPWDWFYGPGYWWFASDYTWYPGWSAWGCVRPHPFWWVGERTPPEVVADGEARIGADGKFKIEIDTALAKELHGDSDHRYEITAEVTDESRRTIVGTGQVLVARQPFKVYAWVDRGHYRAGDTVRADFAALTLDNKPVRGQAELTLFKISYDNERKPVETAAQKWALDTDEQGRAHMQIDASQAGQYRLSLKVSDKKQHTIEGGYVFVVRGEGFTGKEFRFDHIELVTDKREYAPGEKVRLMINTDRANSTVLLFTRPANGIYLAPKILTLAGKSAVEEIEVTKRDMPNFFIEALTIGDGKIHTETREVIVPPEKRVLNLEVRPSAEKYKPGETAKVKVRLTDFAGKPFAGSMAISVYDKSLEYISGGSNVPEIKAFFWKWRRSHQPSTESNLDRAEQNLTPRKREAMQPLGVFGEGVAYDMESPAISGGSILMKGGGSFVARAVTKSARFGKRVSYFGDAPLAEMAPAAVPAEAQTVLSPEPAALPGAPPAAVEPTIRKEFADTAFWNGSIATDANGEAEIELTMPENLTDWRIKTWAMGHGTKVGEGSADVVTAKNVIVRLQAPRFFVEKDEVVLSANIHNYLKNPKPVQAVLELDGKTLMPMGELKQSVEIEAGGEKRVDWRVKVAHEGEAVIRMKALTDEESDAMEQRFPVYVHGILKTESFSGAIRPEKDSASVAIRVPQERRIDQSRLEVRYSPTLAGAMVDALPYLVDYPYGCTEQTLDRFLPTVITQKVLLNMGLDLKSIRDKRANLNAQEIGDAKERAKRWKHWKREPVFDEATVRDMVKNGLRALGSMQLDDGGWGWFSGRGEESYPHTTAFVVHGLQTARDNGVAIVPDVLLRGVDWLKNYQAKQVHALKLPEKNPKSKEHADNLDAFVYMVLADAKIEDREMREFLYRDRNDLSVYAKAMFGLALHKQGHADQLAMISKNIEQFLVNDDENQTAYLKVPESSWWFWYGSEIEADAYYLKLLAKTDPKGERASRMVKYLLNNRKHATYWNSTRDTAIAIEAMAEFLKASGEDKPDMSVEIFIDGKKEKDVTINAENLFSFDNTLVITGDALTSGEHKVEFHKRGRGPLYFNAYVTNFTLEDFITKAGLEVKVQRKVYKLVKVDKTIKAAGSRGQALDQKVEKYERVPLDSGATLKSGDLVEVELEVESKNDYEYLVFEDMKAAGFEPVEVRSGYNGNDMGAYVEFRDERVAFFVRALARGKHSVSYRLRAEIPGNFSALPTRASAMYAPELKANSDEIKLDVQD
jgi:alpha-2-macroglobulin